MSLLTNLDSTTGGGSITPVPTPKPKITDPTPEGPVDVEGALGGN